MSEQDEQAKALLDEVERRYNLPPTNSDGWLPARINVVAAALAAAEQRGREEQAERESASPYTIKPTEHGSYAVVDGQGRTLAIFSVPSSAQECRDAIVRATSLLRQQVRAGVDAFDGANEERAAWREQAEQAEAALRALTAERDGLRTILRRCEPFIAGLTRSHKSLKYDATRVYEQIVIALRTEKAMDEHATADSPRVDPCGDVALAARDEGYEHGRLAGLAVAHADTERVRADYEELIMAVSTKCPGESRHQTALRYIQQGDAGKDQAAAKSAALPATAAICPQCGQRYTAQPCGPSHAELFAALAPRPAEAQP